jgi:DNA repair exonuclease SbcCD ATPase subunit
VIEFALLFGLGFLSATLLAMLIAPAIHGRIVRYTENRLKATMPISPQEVRAQRDMARAVYAAENARTKQELAEERDRTVALQLRYDTLADEAKRLHAETHDLQMQINDMDVEAAEARSRLRQEESHVQQLKAALEAAEETSIGKDLEIESLRQRAKKLAADADNLKIDLSTRDTEVENLKFRINALREERDTLRNDVKLQTTRAKDAENRLGQEESRSMRLEDKLAREISDRADKENALERRSLEISRLREKVKSANAEAREASRALRDGTPSKLGKAPTPKRKASGDEAAEASSSKSLIARLKHGELGPATAALAEDVRNHATAVSERLLNAGSGTNDEALREEIASIAADMVALTADIEGSASPIRTILSGKAGLGKKNRRSLAVRAKDKLASLQDS